MRDDYGPCEATKDHSETWDIWTEKFFKQLAIFITNFKIFGLNTQSELLRK